MLQAISKAEGDGQATQTTRCTYRVLQLLLQLILRLEMQRGWTFCAEYLLHTPALCTHEIKVYFICTETKYEYRAYLLRELTALMMDPRLAAFLLLPLSLPLPDVATASLFHDSTMDQNHAFRSCPHRNSIRKACTTPHTCVLRAVSTSNYYTMWALEERALKRRRDYGAPWKPLSKILPHRRRFEFETRQIHMQEVKRYWSSILFAEYTRLLQ